MKDKGCKRRGGEKVEYLHYIKNLELHTCQNDCLNTMANKLIHRLKSIKKEFKQMGKMDEKNTFPDTEEMNDTLAEQEILNAEMPENEAIAEGSEKAMNDLKAEVVEQKDKFLRLYAEFENYKRRTIKEKIDFMKTASQDTLSALLPVLDDFDRAKKNAEVPGSSEVFSEGISLVYSKLHNILKAKGLEAMDSTGQPFDPEFHEAVTEIPAPTDDLKGKIIDTLEKGYFLNDKIIRHAKVVVGR